MSKLSDAIRRVQRTEATPIGFGSARPAPKATMLVGVLTPAAAVAGARDKGADVIIIDARDGRLSADEVKNERRAAGDAPLGAWISQAARERFEEMRAAGLDFAIVVQATPAGALLVEDLGYVLVLPESYDEALLRSLEALSLEAVWLSALPSPLTVSGQIEVAKVGLLARRPVICEVSADTTKADLECLRSAGVAVVVVGLTDPVAQVKETVMSLPPRRPRREERPAVALPRTNARVEEDEDNFLESSA